MSTYLVNAINVGSFNLGESDKIITLFSAERGLIRAVAKGARKPGSKIGGRSELLAVNRLLIANGRSLDIITQSEAIETFKGLRKDLNRLSYAFYYAELTCHFGQGLSQESEIYFDSLINALRQLSDQKNSPAYVCLIFQLALVHMLGFKPELNACVICRRILTEYDLGVFDHDLGGAVCSACFNAHAAQGQTRKHSFRLAESAAQMTVDYDVESQLSAFYTHITPMVWKKLILASNLTPGDQLTLQSHNAQVELMEKTIIAARHLLERYIEHKAGKQMKSLGLL